MSKERTERLNSLLKEVISEVIHKEVRNPHVNQLITVTRVDITKDLHYAKVYISVIGDQTAKAETLTALQSAAGFIAVNASQKVVMRYFPTLTFKLDDSVDKHMRVATLLSEINAEKKARNEAQENESQSDGSNSHE
ncbi:MAG TPA: 30S ribosome-binding factor RbfA [Parachlamydiaceae bacterium]|nr:30S ribosome-binding factor RbfA [Parachlamydiaceae bacterium]